MECHGNASSSFGFLSEPDEIAIAPVPEPGTFRSRVWKPLQRASNVESKHALND
jgi:hypothetical protein